MTEAYKDFDQPSLGPIGSGQLNTFARPVNVNLSTNKRTMHFVYPGDINDKTVINAPQTKTKYLFPHLSEFFNVKHYDWYNMSDPPQIGPDDIILGHPHPDNNSTMYKLFAQPCAKKYLLFPFHCQLPEYNRYAKPMAQIADKLFLVSGPYWIEQLGNSEFADWQSKVVQVDNAIDSNYFSMQKKQFNDPGQRGLFVFGRSGPEKGIKQLFELLNKTTYPVFIAGRYDDKDLDIIRNRPNTQILGHINWADEQTKQYILDKCDFFVNMSVSDASPTTLLESMSLGLIPITTPQCGYYYPSFMMLDLNNPEYNLQVLEDAQLAEHQQLMQMQAENRKLIEQKHNWPRFCKTIIDQINSDITNDAAKKISQINIQSEPQPTPKIKVAGDYVETGMKVDEHSSFGENILSLFEKIRPRNIIESGTYMGKGTSTIIYRALQKLGIENPLFYTMEVNPNYYNKAKDYFFENKMNIKALLGLSVPRDMLPTPKEIEQKTIELLGDEEIFVDHDEAERVRLYYQETDFSDVPDNLLYKCLETMDFEPDFVLLDSGGHMGEIEFRYLIDNLRGPCHIALDDIYHIKHHNSLKIIKKDPRFELITESKEKFGFCIAKFTPNNVTVAKKPVEQLNLCEKVGNAKSVLFVRPDSIGDIILFNGTLEYFRQIFPQAKISMLVQEHIRQCIETSPFIDKVITFSRKKLFADGQYQQNLLQQLQSQKFDVAINPVYSRDNAGDFLTLSSGAKITIANHGDDTNQNFTQKIEHDKKYTHLVPAKYEQMIETKRNAEFMKGFGIDTQQIAPAIWLTDDDRWIAGELLGKLNVVDPIVISPFGQYSIRNWPVHKWAQLIGKFSDKPVVICGVEKDTNAAQQIIELAERSDVYNLCGKTSIRELGAVIEKSSVCVGVESSAIHIASALGCKNVSITGGGHFGRFVPYSNLTTVVCLPTSCYNCNWQCYYEDAQVFCITQIKVDAVEHAVRYSLETSVEERTKPIIIEQSSGSDKVNLNYKAKESSAVDLNAAEPENKYLVTAIVSTYNSAERIAGCLDDLENQTIAHRLEIVIVDSGSQQNEREIVEQYQQKYDNIKYIRTEQRETVYSAWNRAIKEATGKYITNANTDDRHRNDALELMAKALEANPEIVLTYCDQKWVDENGKTVEEFTAPEHTRYHLLINKCYVSSNPMWRRSLHDEFGYFEGDLFFVCGDWEFWLRISQKYDFLHIKQILGTRRFTEDCISRRNIECKDGIAHLETSFITKCYHYAMEKGINVDAGGLSDNTQFANFFELELLKEKLQAKLQSRNISKADYVISFEDYRENHQPDLSVIIAFNDNNYQYLDSCLDSLNDQTERNFEVILVNYGSQARDTQQLKQNHQLDLCYIQLEKNLGKYFAKNTGADQAKSQAIAFLDADMRADNNFVQNIYTAFQEPGILAIRGRINTLANDNFVPDYYDLGDVPFKTCSEIDSCFAIRVDAFNKAGGFDIDLGAYGAQELSYNIFMTTGEKIDNILYSPDVIANKQTKHIANDHFLQKLDERTSQRIAVRKWLWQKYNLGLKSYVELMRQYYPFNKNKSINDYKKLINITLVLKGNNPKLAALWAKNAININPNISKGHYLLADIYYELGQFKDASESFGNVLKLLASDIQKISEKIGQREIEKYGGAQQCYISSCTKLAQCYMKLGNIAELKKTYASMLTNEYLQLDDNMRNYIQSLLTKLVNSNINNTPNTNITNQSSPAKPDNNISEPVAEQPTPVEAIAPVKDKSKYLVTAIVSTYNSEKFMQQCLEDLEEQTIADKTEIIVVNTGSQQNEEAIVKEFQQKYDNIKYIKTPNRQGMYAAWNLGVKAAQGKYLTNANTDDRHRSDCFEILANELSANPDIALVYSDQLVTNIPNEAFDSHQGDEVAQRPDFSRERLLFGCCTGSQPMWRSKLHNELGYFDESLDCAADWDFWLRIAQKYNFKHIPQSLGLYYHNNDGAEHGRKIHSLYERYLVGKRHGNPYISIIQQYEHPENPLVSVIMPAYNAQQYISFAIESVLIQNYRNFELIVIDDGSTDNTKQIVQSFKNENIRYIYKENGGAASARNIGIQNTNGSFVVMLDSDDMITPDFIEKHLEAFDNNPQADLVYCNDCIIDENDKPLKVTKRPWHSDRRELISDMFSHGYPVIPFRTCIRRDVFDKIGLYDESLTVAEDYDMIRRFIKKGLNLCRLKDAYYLRRIDTGSLSRTGSAKNTACHFEVIKRFTQTFKHEELFPNVPWDNIDPEIRELHFKCLTALIYLTIGQNYIKTNLPEPADKAFENAELQLQDCLKADPANEQIKQLITKSKTIRKQVGTITV